MHITAYLRDGKLPTDDDTLAKKSGCTIRQLFLRQWLIVSFQESQKKDGDRVPPVRQLVVPRMIRDWILQSYHNLNNHIGAEKTYETIRTKYFWLNMYTDVYMYNLPGM